MEKYILLTKLLDYSIKHKLGHIPSALSMFHYLYEIVQIVNKDWNIVIGKPFGSQAYYILWNHFYNLNIDNLSYGVKHDEIDFVDYSEETLGNALGVASGIAYNGKRTWCNISDGALQQGATLEAIQFIGANNQDILLTIDYNNMQLTGKPSDIINMKSETLMNYFEGFGWRVYYLAEYDETILKKIADLKGPVVIFFKTIKGQGVVEMEQDPVYWHYKQLEDNEVTLCENL